MSDIVGLYECSHHGLDMELRVTALVDDPNGATYGIVWADGMAVTVLDESVVREYLDRDQAVKVAG